MPTSGCCCGPCELINETFTGLSALPSQFTSVAGTWTVASNKMSTTSTNAIVTIDNQTRQDIRIRWNADTEEGDILRALVGYLDANNWLCGEYRFTNGFCQCSYISCVAGVETVLNTFTISFPNTSYCPTTFPATVGQLGVGLSGSTMFMKDPAFGYRYFDTGLTPPGSGCALATGSVAAGVSYDSVIVEKWDSACINTGNTYLGTYEQCQRPTAALSAADGWDTHSGTWTQTFNDKLSCTAAGTIVHQMQFNSGQIQYVAAWPLTGISRIMIAYTDIDNYLCVRLDRATGWQLYQRVAGTDTALGTLVATGNNFYELYYNPSNGELYCQAQSGGASSNRSVTVTGFTGLQAALQCETAPAGAGFAVYAFTQGEIKITCKASIP